MQSKRSPAYTVALGGMMAALAVVIMAMGTLIPVATYVCPMLCCLILQLVLKLCGSRIAWAWFAATAILSALLAPDKEAAAVFCAMGYYPIIKPKLEKRKGSFLWKGLFFNTAILILYWLLMHLMGMESIRREFSELGIALTAVLLAMGNVIFFLLDKLLEKKPVLKNKKAGH